MRRLHLQRLRRLGEAGAAAVEFALALPMLAVLVAGVIQYGGLVIANQQMHNGVASGAVYIVRGGTGTDTVQSVALGGWPNKPADAAVTAVQSCTCSGGSAGCTSLCADGSYPQRFITISATATYHGAFADNAMSATQVVRTQ
jgi:Flp pilus assembly protein TadG